MLDIASSIRTMSSLEELSYHKTVIHRINSVHKIIVTVLYLIAVISFDRYSISGLMPLLLYPVLMMTLGEIPFRMFFSRVAVTLPFPFFAALPNLFLDRITFTQVQDITITFGMLSFFSVVFKSILMVAAVLILVATTQMTDLSAGMTFLKVPDLLILQFLLTYRYLQLILSETASMITAYQLRAGKEKGILTSHGGSFLGLLLLRCYDRAQLLYFAMKCRGFQGHMVKEKISSTKVSDLLFLVTSILFFGITRFINLSLLLSGIF